MNDNQLEHPTTIVLRHEGSPGALADCLDAIQRSDGVESVREVVVLDASTAPTPSGSWTFPISPVRTLEVDRLVRDAGGGIVLWTRSEVHLQPKAISAHRRAHERPGVRIGVGRTKFFTPAMTDDRAIFFRPVIRDPLDLFCEPFPSNTSLPVDALRRLGLDSTLSAGFEFVDLALRTPSALVDAQKVAGAVALAPVAPSAVQSARHQAAAARALGAFLHVWPDYFPAHRLRRRISQVRDLLPEYDAIRAELFELERGRAAGSPPGDSGRLAEASRRLALIASVRALLRTTGHRLARDPSRPARRGSRGAVPADRFRSGSSGFPLS